MLAEIKAGLRGFIRGWNPVVLRRNNKRQTKAHAVVLDHFRGRLFRAHELCAVFAESSYPAAPDGTYLLVKPLEETDKVANVVRCEKFNMSQLDEIWERITSAGETDE